jgi:DNA gyrase subunit A
VLETKLYRLGKLEIRDILDELAKRRERAQEIRRLLADERALWKIIRGELKGIASAYGEPRRTRIEAPATPVEYREEDYIVDEDAWVIVTRDGWTKRQKTFTDVASIRVRDDDRVGWIYRATARQTLTFFTDRGTAYTLRANDIPLTTGHGEPIQKQFAFEDREHLVGVICHDARCLPASAAPTAEGSARLVQGLLPGEMGQLNGENGGPAPPPPPYAVAMTAGGKVLRFPFAPLASISTRKGRVIVRLDPAFRDDVVLGVEATDGTETLCLATRMARVLLFHVAEANVVSGAAKGVMGIKLDPRDHVLGFALANKMREGLTVTTNRGATIVVRATKYPVTGRGGKGQSVLQRGSLEGIVHDEARAVPTIEEVGDG